MDLCTSMKDFKFGCLFACVHYIGDLVILWMTQEHAPRDILKLTSCSCKHGCSTQRCSCRKQCLPCTDVYKCKDCQSPFSSHARPHAEQEAAEQPVDTNETVIADSITDSEGESIDTWFGGMLSE